jgi:predicted nucleotidyltransferase
MRLSDFEIDAIRKTVSQTFGPAVSVWLFGSRVDDSKRGGDLDLLIVAESDQIRIDVLKKETDFLVALKQLIGEQKIDLIAATPESLASDPFLLSLSARIPLMGTHAIKITPELIETSHLFLKTHNINRNAAPLNDYLIYSDGRVVALVEIAKTTVAGDASTAVITQSPEQADDFKSLVLAVLRKTLSPR